MASRPLATLIKVLEKQIGEINYKTASFFSDTSDTFIEGENIADGEFNVARELNAFNDDVFEEYCDYPEINKLPKFEISKSCEISNLRSCNLPVFENALKNQNGKHSWCKVEEALNSMDTILQKIQNSFSQGTNLNKF